MATTHIKIVWSASCRHQNHNSVGPFPVDKPHRLIICLGHHWQRCISGTFVGHPVWEMAHGVLVLTRPNTIRLQHSAWILECPLMN